MSSTVDQRAGLVARCVRCGTELAPTMLACPACSALVHAERLKGLAAQAEESAAAGKLAESSRAWQQALDLLPPNSQQHSAISVRVNEIAKQLAAAPGAAIKDGTSWYKRGTAVVGALVVLALTKGKFLLLGLTKLKTLVSMFAFFGVYWAAYGWPLALGIALSLYIHEIGHVAELKRLGIEAGAPLFIPGLGAFVLLKQRITDPAVDARVGLAGPLWGLGAGLAAYAVYRITDIPVWGAIAALTGLFNLFNLLPVWQLDGSRAFHALASWQRWLVVSAIGAAYYATRHGLLILIGIVALWRAFQRVDVKADRYAFITYLVLLGALVWLTGVHEFRG